MGIKSSVQIPDAILRARGWPRRSRIAWLYTSLAAFVAAPFLLCASLFLASCGVRESVSPTGKPIIEFTSVPRIGRFDAIGNAAQESTIGGRVIGAQPGQQIVLYAHASNETGQPTWYVQPFVREPFTKIDSDSRWRNTTHPGREYAALLVGPGFQPPWTTPTLPTDGVITVAVTGGWPPIWRNWWFPWISAIAAAALIWSLYQAWLLHVTNKLNLRFEERLSERMRIAQDLHDTLLQGVVSASMQLHVAVDNLPSDSPARPNLERTLQLMAHVIDEGRNTLRGLRSTAGDTQDLKTSFLQIPQELANRDVEFRVIVQGETLALRPAIHDEVYRIGREALVNAFRHAHAASIDVQLQYHPHQLRLVVSDDGCGIDPQVVQTGRDGHWGLAGMRARAEHLGAKLRLLSGPAAGTEVELLVPGQIAFASKPSSGISKWLGRWWPKWKPAMRESQGGHNS